jgi:hypothetical protein
VRSPSCRAQKVDRGSDERKQAVRISYASSTRLWFGEIENGKKGGPADAPEKPREWEALKPQPADVDIGPYLNEVVR